MLFHLKSQFLKPINNIKWALTVLYLAISHHSGRTEYL